MPVAANNAPRLEGTREGGWRLNGWASARIVAGITSRHLDSARLLRSLRAPAVTVEAEQVHGSSIAIIGRASVTPQIVPGCDALLTGLAGVTLFIRTADCLPVFFAAPSRGVVGLAHAGWRGLAADLPARMVAAVRHVYHARADELWVAIGPAIRSCCYDVGPEFRGRFGPFVHERGGRRTCDLVSAALDQLRRCGVRSDRVLDTQQCTACDIQRWFSLRQEGPSTGRLTSLIMLQP